MPNKACNRTRGPSLNLSDTVGTPVAKPWSFGGPSLETPNLAFRIRQEYTLLVDIHERLAYASGFQWDSENIQKSWDAHQVTSAECEQVFFNQPLVVAADFAHSQLEERFFALGRSDSGRLLFIAFILRTDLIRVISARDTSRKERKVFDSHG
jgi:uncharacterized DUF497 family protein